MAASGAQLMRGEFPRRQHCCSRAVLHSFGAWCAATVCEQLVQQQIIWHAGGGLADSCSCCWMHRQLSVLCSCRTCRGKAAGSAHVCGMYAGIGIQAMQLSLHTLKHYTMPAFKCGWLSAQVKGSLLDAQCPLSCNCQHAAGSGSNAVFEHCHAPSSGQM